MDILEGLVSEVIAVEGEKMLKKLPLDFDIESKIVLKKVNSANKSLAELKGLLKSLPNKYLLLNTLMLREAKESSEIENIITTNDELFKADIKIKINNRATKEVIIEKLSRIFREN